MRSLWREDEDRVRSPSPRGCPQHPRVPRSAYEAYKVHNKGLCYVKVDPNIDPLRCDPRYGEFLGRMNFPK